MTRNQATLNQSPAAAICPRCLQANHCAVAEGKAAERCWCMTANLNPARVEGYAGQQRCLCSQCGQALSDDSLSEGSQDE